MYKRRARFNGLSVKIGTIFAKPGLSPNQWTILTVVPALASVWFLMREQFILAAAFFGIAAFIDIIDGSVARVTGKVTRFGAYLDTMVDRYVEGMVVFGLLFASLPPLTWPDSPAFAWVFLYFFGSMMTTYAKAAAKEKDIVEEELKGGILERAERLIILFAGILLASLDPLFLTYIIALLAVLSNVSALQRVWIARKASLARKEFKD